MYALVKTNDLTDRLGHAALESDRYGHPKKNCPTRLDVQVRCNWMRVPQADRFGHVTNPSQSATGCDRSVGFTLGAFPLHAKYPDSHL